MIVTSYISTLITTKRRILRKKKRVKDATITQRPSIHGYTGKTSERKTHQIRLEGNKHQENTQQQGVELAIDKGERRAKNATVDEQWWVGRTSRL